MKKQIIFIEPKPTIYTYRIARTLKLTGKYETVLVCFSKIDKKFFGKAYDKFHILEWSHKPNFKNFIDFFRKLFGKGSRTFFNKLKSMRPYIFQVTGTDLFSMIAMFYLKKSPVIYFPYDTWSADKRNFLFTKNPGIKGCFQQLFERICFKMADGILHKGQSGTLELLGYDLNIPDLSFIPSCLDEWICPIKNKIQDKEIQLGYAGAPWPSEAGLIPFSEVVKNITAQKMHFHAFGDFVNKKEKRLFYKEIKDKSYFHIHEKERVDKLNKRLSQYDYGVILCFYDDSLNPLLLEKLVTNRLFSYIESGLPIVVPKQFKFMVNMVEGNKIGFSLDRKDLKNLKRIIMEQNNKKMRENMKQAQEKFKLSKRIKELEKFYDELQKPINLKKGVVN